MHSLSKPLQGDFRGKYIRTTRACPAPAQIRTCPRVEEAKEAAKSGVGCRLWFAVEQGEELAFDYRHASPRGPSLLD